MNECHANGARVPVSHGESSPKWLSVCIFLTRREREILQLLEEGLSNKDVAVRLEIEVQTVKNHVRQVFVKLGVKRRREAVRYPPEHRGLVHF
ncbi:MAG: helix-turn-helix transcriptional regulator [Nitrospirota bacterium]